MKRGIQSLYDTLREYKLPVTIKIEKSHQLSKVNGLCTIQHRRPVTQLEFLQSSGSTSFIPVSKEDTALVIMVEHTEDYRTIEELRASKKKNKIHWFISSKEFQINNVFCHVGYIFKFAPTSLLRSFRRGKRGVYVLFYPTMERHFVPMDTEGHFYKCECPSTWKRYKLGELAKMKRFPCLLAFQGSNLQIKDGIEISDIYFTLNIIENDILYASKKSRGSLKLHTFSAHAPMSVIVQPNIKPIDSLDANELDIIVKSITLPFDTDLRHFYEVRSYQELGIIRLLEEIMGELTSRVNNFSRFNSERRPPNRGRNGESIKKQMSLSTGVCSSRKIPNNIMASSYNMRQAYDSHTHRHYQYHHVYTNGTLLNSGINNSKVDIVDVDDNGYVIVPCIRDISNIPNKDNEPCEYKTSENSSYNYEFRMLEDIDNHIYTYIHPIISDNIDDKIQHSEISSLSDQHGDNDDENITEHHDVIDEGYNVVYDYSHIGRILSSHKQTVKIKELNLEEVIDLLKVVKMKQHTDSFRKNFVDGNKLSSYGEKDLTNLNLTKFECVKLLCFVDGWRPLKTTLSGDAWLTQMVCDWSVDDLCKYLLHKRMRSLHKFCSNQDVDGFLLKKLIEGDVIHTLVDHGVTFKENNIGRLKAYVLQDERPKFQFVER